MIFVMGLKGITEFDGVYSLVNTVAKGGDELIHCMVRSDGFWLLRLLGFWLS